MIPVKARIVKRPPSAAEIAKQMDFGTAVGLTNTAKDGQKAVQGALRGTFTIRNRWLEVGPLAIKIKPATKTDLSSEIRTNADFLIPHETGKDKTGRGGHRVAVPTKEVRRNKRDIIAKANRPSALRGKRTFVAKTKRGDVLFQRKFKGKRSFITPLYGLERRVKIKRQSTFEEPIAKVVRRRLGPNIEAGIRRAFATMR